MPDPQSIASALAKLATIACKFTRPLIRLRAERAAGRDPPPPDPLRQILADTFDRLRGGEPDDSWWRRVLDRLGHAYITPTPLRDPDVRKWLSDETVVEDLMGLAAAHLLQTAEPAGARERSESRYTALTETHPQAARTAVDIVLAVLVGGYLAAIPRDQRPLAGLFQTLPGQLTPPTDPIIRDVHTRVATSELERLLALRGLPGFRPERASLDLHSRIDSTAGDLAAARQDTKRQVRYWTARLCAAQEDTLGIAQELTSKLSATPAHDLAILNARIAETSGDTERCLRILRDVDSADARSALFGSLVRIQGRSAALRWFDEHSDSSSPDFLTGLGWCNWAVAMAMEERWDEASERCGGLEARFSQTPAFALVSGTLHAARFLPDEHRPRALEDAPLHVGIAPIHVRDANATLGRARDAFRTLSAVVADTDLTDCQQLARRWLLWLKLMDPDKKRAVEARIAVGEHLVRDPRAVWMAPFAWAFGVEFDARPLARRMEMRRQTGGLKGDELVAECLANRLVRSPHDFEAYIVRNRAALSEVFSSPFLAALGFDALLRDRRQDDARAFLFEKRQALGEANYERLRIALDEGTHEIKRETLETLYFQTKSLADLKALVAHLAEADDEEALLARLRELFAMERNPANARSLAGALARRESAGWIGVLDFLDQNDDLLEHSVDLRAMQARALAAAGRFRAAQNLNRSLREERDSWEDSDLALVLAISTGEWEQLPALIGEEWRRKASRDGQQLIALADIARYFAETEKWATCLARLATEKAPEDPAVLLGAYVITVAVGRDDFVDPAWLPRAAARSSEDAGPVWSHPLRSLAEEVIPERRERLDAVRAQVVAGELPMAVAAEERSAPLANALFRTPEHNASVADGRVRAIVPIVSAARRHVEIDQRWTIGLDITSVMVLEYIGLLGTAIGAFRRVALSPDAFSFLFSERRALAFHQPSQMRHASEVLRHLREGSLRTVGGNGVPRRELAAEVGMELAQLLTTARANHSRVVVTRPIYRYGSLDLREANLDGYAGQLVSAAELFAALYRAGGVSERDHWTAQTLLADNAVNENETPEAADGRTAFLLHRDTLHRIQAAGLLEALAAAGWDLQIHPRVEAESRALVAEKWQGAKVGERVEAIRHALRTAVESGKAFLLERETGAGVPGGTDSRAFEVTRWLLAGAGKYDALCIDDRALNRLGGLRDSGGDSIPIIGVFDVLRALRGWQVVSDDDYHDARHRLRAGGFGFAPPEAEELTHWLKKARLSDGELREGPELRVIRQTARRTETARTTPPQEILNHIMQARMAGMRALWDVWGDPEATGEDAAGRATWLWRHLADACIRTPGDAEPGAVRSRNRERLLLDLALLFYPCPTLPSERGAVYRSWLEKTVLPTLLPANADTVEEAWRKVHPDIRSLDENQALVGHMFFAQLPEAVRGPAISADREFAARCGFERRERLTLGPGLRSDTTALIGAVRRSFAERKPVPVQGLDGVDFEVEARPGEPSVLVRGEHSGKRLLVRAPALAVFAPGARLRHRALSRLIESLGPAAPDFTGLVRSAANRELRREEVASLFQEMGSGVNAVQGRLAERLRCGNVVALQQIVPPSLGYFDRFAGPDPRGQDPESYFRKTLITYRRTLLKRSLARGLGMCVLGSLRDDLSPGKWLSRRNDDSVWEALQSSGADASPFALLGALDIAMYRAHDARFRKYAVEAIEKLGHGNLGHEARFDTYGWFAAITELVRNRAALLDGGAARPNYWRRMAALMQAGLVLRHMRGGGFGGDLGEFTVWTHQNMFGVGPLADFVGYRAEPMVSADLVNAESLRMEVRRRLRSLLTRHEKRRNRPRWSAGVEAAVQAERHREEAIGGVGPLEGHGKAMSAFTEAVRRDIEAAVAQGGAPMGIPLLAFMSETGAMERADRERARTLVREALSRAAGDVAKCLATLYSAGAIAAASRDKRLADELAESLIGVSRELRDAKHVHEIVRVLLLGAAAHEEESEWWIWLEKRLRELADNLPGPPSDALRVFVDVCHGLEVAVPAAKWFHVSARAAASAGVQ